ncbi:MAG TPA: hypothetical protein VHT05_00105 [Candidatus Elarobacter sp.]|nr:hypothetical protein [Candidatus Elarobacter sp.]
MAETWQKRDRGRAAFSAGAMEVRSMRTLLILAAMTIGCVTAAAAAGASAAPSDTLCPETVSRVLVLTKMKASDPPASVYDASKAAIDQFQICLDRQLNDGNVEPGVHYAQLRESQFGVLAARALIALGRTDDARTELERDRKLAANVADWQFANSGSNIGANQGTYGRYSDFHDAAKQVVTAVDAELARLPPHPH